VGFLAAGLPRRARAGAVGAMKIVLLTHSINPRGGVVHVLELGRALRDRGHEVVIIAPALPGQRFFRATPCRVELATLRPGGADVAAQVRLRIEALRTHLQARARAERHDVLHAHDGIGANALADLVQQGAIGSYLRTVHHLDRYSDPRLQAWEERSIRGAARVLCVSSVWRERLLAEHGIAAVQVPNGIDLERFSPGPDPADAQVARRHGLAPGAPVVLFVGGIEARKNPLRLLQAFALARRRLPRLQLVIAGGASLLDHGPQVLAFRAAAAAADLQLAEGGAGRGTEPGPAPGPGAAVIVTGPLPDADMPALYRRAAVVAMPSLIEGFGLAALEALACGTPALVARRAPFTEHFAEGDVQWADPLDVDSIATGLLRAIAGGRHGTVAAVCRRFSWSASAERHEALYRAPQPA